MLEISSKISNHNDWQKIGELDCVRRWLTVYNAVNQTTYDCLRANYFQSETDVYAYRDKESGRPLRIQVSRARRNTLTQIIEKKKNLYSSADKADLILLIDFQGESLLAEIINWQKKHLELLSNAGFWEIWLVGHGALIVELWPGRA